MLHGGQISKRNVLFSADGKLILAPCGQEVRVYAAATGELVLKLEGHSGDVTCIALNPGQVTEVYSASLDGTLRLWDYISGECLKVLTTQEVVRHMVLHAALRTAYLSIEWRDGQSGRVITYQLDKGRAGACAMKTRLAGPLAMNPNGSLVATIDRQSLFIWRVGLEISQPLNLHHTKAYTCLAISANDSVVAAGDVSGRILIWRNVEPSIPQYSKGAKGSSGADGGAASGLTPPAPPPPCTTVHWHSGPVGCLCFSPDTTYLRSGGREGVLVSWQLETNNPNFLPRLGGALLGMTHCDRQPSDLLLRQADNTLRVIDLASNVVSTSVLGLRPPVPYIGSTVNMSATQLQPGSDLLCVPTHNAALQVFDTTNHRHIAMMQLMPRNDVSTTSSAQEVDGQVLVPYISHSAFTASGRTLAAVIVKPASSVYEGVESTLQFWDVQQLSGRPTNQAPASLNTVADEPHRGIVTCMAAHPSLDLIVTAGGELLGGPVPGSSQPEFKVWERVAVPRRPGSKIESPSCWRCRSVASYKGLSFSAAAFSSDGSILALACGSKVTLWDPLTCALAGVLPTPPELLTSSGNQAPAPLSHVAFIAGTQHLVGSTGHCVVVWNLLTMSVQWAAPVRCCSLAAHPHHASFAVVVPLPPRPRSRPAQQSQRGPPGHADGKGRHKHAPVAAKTSQQQGGTEEGSQGGAVQHSHPAAPACAVLVFEPSAPLPIFMSVLPRTRVAQVLYKASSSGRGQSDATGAGGVLVLTEDRAYAELDVQGAAGAVQQQGGVQAGAVAKLVGQEASAYEAAFGPLVDVDAGGVAQGDGDVHMVDAVSRVKQLFDAPSHALPPPNALAATFMRLLTEQV